MTQDMSVFIPPADDAPLPPAMAQPMTRPVAAAAPVLALTSSALPRSRAVLGEMPDLGILNWLLADESIHDILINGTGPIYIDRDGQLQDSGVRFSSHTEVLEIAQRIMDAIGQQWSPERPLIDTRLADGSRVNIVAPPMAVDGVSISIRKFPALRVTMDSMVTQQQISKEAAEFLKNCAARRLNIIVAGGTGSGKTTLLNALSASIPANERIVTIEDSAELRLQQPHVVRLESKPPVRLDAPHTAVTIRDLVKNALRMRPDRIIVGESRGPEAFDMLQAMNTGHDGSMTSLHANSPREALSRLETMLAIAMPQLGTRVLRQQIASTIHLMIQIGRGKDGMRRISHITEVSGMEGEIIIMQDLLLYQEAAGGKPGEHRWVAASPRNPLVTEAAREAGIIRAGR